MVIAGLQWSTSAQAIGWGQQGICVCPPCLCCCLTNPLVVNGWDSTLMTLYNPSQPSDTIRLSFCPLNTSVAIKLQQELSRGQHLLQTALFSYIVYSEIFSQFYSPKPQTGSNSNKGNLFPHQTKDLYIFKVVYSQHRLDKMSNGTEAWDNTLICIYLEAVV